MECVLEGEGGKEEETGKLGKCMSKNEKKGRLRSVGGE